MRHLIRPLCAAAALSSCPVESSFSFSPETICFPSLEQLGKRYGVSKNRIWQYASKHKCLERRKESEVREKTRYDRIVNARRAEARPIDDEVAIGNCGGTSFGKVPCGC